MAFNVIAVIFARQKYKNHCKDLNLTCKDKRRKFSS